MKPTRRAVALYMALVFLCGGVVGAFAFRLYTVSGVSANAAPRNPEEFRKKFLADLQGRLKLDQDQSSKVAAILDETRKRFKATRDSVEPQMQKIREDQRQKISELLSPSQMVEWQKIVEERRRERETKMKSRGESSPR